MNPPSSNYHCTGAVALVLSWVNPKDAGDYKCEFADDLESEEIWQGFTLHVIRTLS